MKRTYDKCPMCGVPIPHDVLYDTFVGADYRTEFTLKCPKCIGTIVVEVESVPEFSMTAKDEP